MNANSKKTRKKPRRVFRKKPCRLCQDKIKEVDYRNAELLQKFISDRGKILPVRISGSCTKHQRMVAKSIKRARIAGLLPFVKQKTSKGGFFKFRSDRSDRSDR